VTFEVKAVEIAGRLEPGQTIPAKVRGILTVKQKPVERVAEATVTYIKLTPEQLETQRRFGFTSDNVKVRAKLATTFTDRGMQVPQILFFTRRAYPMPRESRDRRRFPIHAPAAGRRDRPSPRGRDVAGRGRRGPESGAPGVEAHRFHLVLDDA
jgi:hypothetical protein